MPRVDTRQLRPTLVVVGASTVMLTGLASAGAQVQVLPGTTTVLDITTSAETCFTDATSSGGIEPVKDCFPDADANPDTQLRVLAVSGLSDNPDTFFGQTVQAIGTLSQVIEIPVASTDPSSDVLPVQIATEVTWSGGTVVAGLDSTFAQVVATFQVRDVTDADDGPVVVSDTFLFERTDADFDIPLPDQGAVNAIADFLNLIDIVDISNSSGTDVTVLLARGRQYQIEIEAKCDVQVPILGFGACLFSSDLLDVLNLDLPTGNGFPALDNDGFSATNISVTVGSDPVQDLFLFGGL
jgi:hypothetical protein